MKRRKRPTYGAAVSSRNVRMRFVQMLYGRRTQLERIQAMTIAV